MKTIIKYVANDNEEFSDEKECIKYEALMLSVDKIMSKLPIVDNTCDFTNGSGYYQHDKNSFNEARRELLVLCLDYIDHRWIQESIDDDLVHYSYVSRLIGEIRELNPVNKAWNRLACVDGNYKEWGQIYFTTHQEEAQNICLN